MVELGAEVLTALVETLLPLTATKVGLPEIMAVEVAYSYPTRPMQRELKQAL